MGRMQRNKGAQGEREFAALLSEAMGVEIKRKLGAARDGGDDVVHGSYSFEVKRHEAVQIEAWMRQANENAQGRIPVVVFRRNNSPWRACLNLPDFFKLMKAAGFDVIRRQ